jgi:DHA2 family multidrug resistance protein-like MFS transporter
VRPDCAWKGIDIVNVTEGMTKHIPHDGLEGPRRYIAIAVISLGTILTALDSSIMNIALPTLRSEFHVSAAASVLIVNAYQIAVVVSLLPLAALGAVIGYRRVFLAGLCVYVAASFICATSGSLAQIAIGRGIQGIGAAGVMSVLHAMIRSVYPARLLGRGLGVNSMFVASSSTMGPTVAATILSILPWPFLFLINLPLGVMALAVGYWILPWNERSTERYDTRAAIMTATSLGLFILAIDGISHGGSPIISIIELAVVAVVAPILVKSQWDHPTPFLPVDIFRNRIVPLSLIAGQCGFIAQLLTFVTLPFYLHMIGFTQVQIGLVMTPWPLTIAVTAPVAGILCDRYPAGVIGTIGLSLTALALLSIAFVPAGANAWDFVWRMGLAGLGYGLFSPPNLRQIMHAAPKHRSGVTGGLIGTNRLTGQSIGAALAALVLTVAPNNANVVALSLAAGMAMVGAGVSLMRAPAQVEARQASKS